MGIDFCLRQSIDNNSSPCNCRNNTLGREYGCVSEDHRGKEMRRHRKAVCIEIGGLRPGRDT